MKYVQVLAKHAIIQLNNVIPALLDISCSSRNALLCAQILIMEVVGYVNFASMAVKHVKMQLHAYHAH